MKVINLPEDYKVYTVVMTDKSEYTIFGKQKVGIMGDQSQFIEFENGTILNKSFIIEIRFNGKATTELFRALPKEQQEKIVSSITIQ